MDKYIKSYRSFRQYEPPKKGGLFSFFSRKRKYGKVTNRFDRTPINAVNKPSFTRPTSSKNYRNTIILSSLGGIALCWLILMIYLPYFRINKITFAGLKIINQNDIETYLTDKYIKGGMVIPNNNYFLVNASDITKDIADKYAVDSVEVKKIFPGKISVLIQEKVTTIIYDNGQSYSLLDKDGTVIKIIEQYADAYASSSATVTGSPELLATLSTSTNDHVAESTSTLMGTGVSAHKPDFKTLSKDYADIPILFDARKQYIAENQTSILPSSIIASIIEWQKIMREQTIGEVRYFTTENPPAGLKVYLDQPWYLLIQPKNSTAEQINSLKSILANREIKPAEYIDIRFGERVFWK